MREGRTMEGGSRKDGKRDGGNKRRKEGGRGREGERERGKKEGKTKSKS